MVLHQLRVAWIGGEPAGDDLRRLVVLLHHRRKAGAIGPGLDVLRLQAQSCVQPGGGVLQFAEDAIGRRHVPVELGIGRLSAHQLLGDRKGLGPFLHVVEDIDEVRQGHQAFGVQLLGPLQGGHRLLQPALPAQDDPQGVPQVSILGRPIQPGARPLLRLLVALAIEQPRAQRLVGVQGPRAGRDGRGQQFYAFVLAVRLEGGVGGGEPGVHVRGPNVSGSLAQIPERRRRRLGSCLRP